MDAKEAKILKAELVISHILRWGVLLCALVIIVGWVLGLNQVTMAGLLFLICLPISRVFAAALIFLFQKDYIYVFLSIYVLCVLIASLVLGKSL